MSSHVILSDGQGVHAPTSIYPSASLEHVQLAVAGPDLDWLGQLDDELIALAAGLCQAVTGRQLMIEGFRLHNERMQRTDERCRRVGIQLDLQACSHIPSPAAYLGVLSCRRVSHAHGWRRCGDQCRAGRRSGGWRPKRLSSA